MYARALTAIQLGGACIAAGFAFWPGPAHGADSVRIEISGNAVTIEAIETSVRGVLEALSRHTGLVVVSEQPLDTPVSIDIDQPSLPRAIRRLLRHESYLLQQSNHTAGKLWVFPDATDSGELAWSARPAPRSHTEQDREFRDYEILASSGDAADREEAMSGFGELGGSNGRDYLILGLSDPDAGVREEAILSLADFGGKESVMALGTALFDPEASVRADAVDALGELGGDGARKLLQVAMTDTNATVREAAAEWLTELK